MSDLNEYVDRNDIAVKHEELTTYMYYLHMMQDYLMDARKNATSIQERERCFYFKRLVDRLLTYFNVEYDMFIDSLNKG